MLITLGFLEPPELIVILVIVLLIFGPGKLPDIGKSLGKGIKEFKNATEGKEKTKTTDLTAGSTGTKKDDNDKIEGNK